MPVPDVPAGRVRRWDVMIIDHPGLGAAIAAGAIQPLRRLVPRDVEDEWKATSFVPTWDSYVVGGQPCSRRGVCGLEQAICMGTHDAAEGRSAFAEKRSPKFTGH